MKIRDFLDIHVNTMASMLVNLMINDYDPKTLLKDAEENCPMLVEALKVAAKDVDATIEELNNQFNSDHIGVFAEPDQTDEDGNLVFPAAYSAEILKQSK